MQDTLDVCRVHGFQSEPDPMLRLMTENPRMQTTLDSRHTHLTCNELKHMDLTDLVNVYSVSDVTMTSDSTDMCAHCMALASLHTYFLKSCTILVVLHAI